MILTIPFNPIFSNLQEQRKMAWEIEMSRVKNYSIKSSKRIDWWAEDWRNQDDLTARNTGSVHTTLEEFEKGVFTLKTHQMFSVHTIPVILDLCLRKTRSGKSYDYRDVIVFEKLRFQNVFRPHENQKPAFSNSSFLPWRTFSKSSVFVTDWWGR